MGGCLQFPTCVMWFGAHGGSSLTSLLEDASSCDQWLPDRNSVPASGILRWLYRNRTHDNYSFVSARPCRSSRAPVILSRHRPDLILDCVPPNSAVRRPEVTMSTATKTLHVTRRSATLGHKKPPTMHAMTIRQDYLPAEDSLPA